MAFALADRVVETTSTEGTGTYDLNGAITGFQTFVAGVGDGNNTFYAVTDDTDWEVGIGTVTDASPDTLSRDTIIASSNSGAAVSWGSGSKTVFVDVPASKRIYIDDSGRVPELDATDIKSVGRLWQNFTLEIRNNGGTIEHRIGRPGAAGNSTQFATKINGATNASWTSTPTGTDSSTAMAGGGKIGSASTDIFHFDVADQSGNAFQAMASLGYDDVGTDLLVEATISNIDINGTTQVRLAVDFTNGQNGSAFDLTSIAAGKSLRATIMAYLA